MGPSCHGTWSHISPSPTESLISTPASAQKPQDRTQQVGQLSNPRRLTTDLALTPDHLVPPASLCKSPLPPLHPHLLTLIPSVAKPVALDWNLFPDLRISKEKHFWKANFWKAKGRPLSEPELGRDHRGPPRSKLRPGRFLCRRWGGSSSPSLLCPWRSVPSLGAPDRLLLLRLPVGTSGTASHDPGSLLALAQDTKTIKKNAWRQVMFGVRLLSFLCQERICF